jgi:2-octaprenyl-6-methoxyphenol hydroxylase
MHGEKTADVAVVGGGASGLIAALALAQSGCEVVLFAPSGGPDRRTTALLDGSARTLETLDVWPRLVPHAAPLSRLRIVDGTHRLLRAPEVLFEAAELGLDAFGYNIENDILQRILRELIAAQPLVRLLATSVSAVAREDEVVLLRGGERDERVPLVVGADGRKSLCREAAGIQTRRREFPQVALTVNLLHARPHEDISTEFHTETGPFTLVPLAGNRSSLVCVVGPQEAKLFAEMDDAALALEIEKRAHSILGRMEIDGPRGNFPLMIETAETMAARRIVLVGEAAHTLPPIGAQGLNLGIRDAAVIAELVADARREGRDAGGDALLVAYEATRRPDVRNRSMAVELMNRSLLTDFLPVHAARGFGLELASRFGFLRRALMREGLGPRDSNAPRLARGERL